MHGACGRPSQPPGVSTPGHMVRVRVRAKVRVRVRVRVRVSQRDQVLLI